MASTTSKTTSLDSVDHRGPKDGRVMMDARMVVLLSGAVTTCLARTMWIPTLKMGCRYDDGGCFWNVCSGA